MLLNTSFNSTLMRLGFIRRLYVEFKSHCASAFSIASTNLLRFIKDMVQNAQKFVSNKVFLHKYQLFWWQSGKLPPPVAIQLANSWNNTTFRLTIGKRQEGHLLPVPRFSKKLPS